MNSLLNELLTQTHWPSWIRGAAVLIVVSSLFEADFITAFIGFILYVIGYVLQRRIPYRWDRWDRPKE